MSRVWRRLQRVGKTAYKFEFTIKVHTVTLECVSGWTPNQVSVLWVRRGRRVRTEATSWKTLPGKDTQGVVHWQALEATITLYRDANEIKKRKKFEDKFWTLIVENVGKNGKHKALATKRINMADFVNLDLRTLETRQKYQMKPVASKVHLTEVQVTFISKFEKQGPATDDDMKSISSEMSELNLSAFGDGYMSEGEFDDEFLNNTNPEENEKIMREIAAIGADFQQLTSFSTDDIGDPSSDPLNPPNVKSNGVDHEQILIDWSNKELAEEPGYTIANMRDSWQSGYPFCAIIHRYHPETLSLNPTNDPYTNVKLASKAAVKIGLSPTIDPLDFHKGKLDKLGIITFVDQMYKTFRDLKPVVNLNEIPRKSSTSSGVQADETSMPPSDSQSEKKELEADDEKKRRREMIERGRLRLNKRRPNSRKTNVSATSSTNSNTSLNDTSSPQRHISLSKMKHSPARYRRNQDRIGSSPSISSPGSPVVVTQKVDVHSPSVSSHRSVQSSLKSDSKEHVKSPQTSRSSVHSDVDVIDVVIRSIQDETPEQESSPIRIEPQYSKPVKSGIPASVASDDKNLELNTEIPALNPDDLFREFEKQVSLEAKTKSENDPRDKSLKTHSSSSSSSSLSSDSESGSCEALIRSLQRSEERKKKRSLSSSDNKENELTSPSNIKISTIKSDDDQPAVIGEDLKQKFNESRDEAAVAKEALLSRSESSLSASDRIEVSVSIEIPQTKAELDTPPETPDVADDEIDKEIDALEKGIESGKFRIKPYKPPSSEVRKEVINKPIVYSRENTAPTPPETPPVPAKRGQSLRDKIRGLHESRQKLMAATTDSTLTVRSPERLTPTPKVSVPRRRLPNSQSSQESNERAKPVVAPKPTARPSSREGISILQTKSPDSSTIPSPSVHSSSSSLSLGPENAITVAASDPKPVQDAGTVITQPASVDSQITPVSSEDETDGNIHVIVSEVPEVRSSLTTVLVTEDVTPEKLSVAEKTPNHSSYSSPPKESPDKRHPPPPPPPPSDNVLVYSSPPKPSSSPRHIESLDELISSFSTTPVEVTMATEGAATNAEFTAQTPGESHQLHKALSGSVGLSEHSMTSTSSSSLSHPPPPPAPEPLSLMMGADESDEEPDNEPLILAQDLKDIRDYINECNSRIARHSAKLDKRAKVLEKELRDVMDAQNHELEQRLLKSWLQLVHERNTLVRKQDELNSLQNEEDLEERCCAVMKEIKRYQIMKDSEKTESDFAREVDLDEEYKELLKKREMLLRIREDINAISLEEESELQSVLERPKLLQDQSNCRIS